MCQKCVKRLKNLGTPKVPTRVLNRLAYYFEKGYGIPLFDDKASNYYIEAWLYLQHKYHTDKTRYTRKSKYPVSHETD